MPAMSRGIYIMNILNILDNLRMLNTLNILEVRYSRYSRSKILMDSRLNILPLQTVYRSVYDGFTACLHAGHASFLFTRAWQPGGQDHRKNAVKLARFLHVLGVKNGSKATENSLIMVIDNYAKSIYHNHELQNPHFLLNNRLIQMINDLQRRFENAEHRRD